MRMASKCLHRETQNANKLISSIISTKCPKNDPEIGLLPAGININKRFRKC